ncbi:integral membrane protein S linking to the trans Golgi network-domain-containing protein, partial [Piptocephalis cylindrospora]
PILLLSQIVCLQAAFYTFNSVAVLCAEAYTNADISLDHILDPTEFRGDTVLGWSLSLCWLLSSGFGSLLLVRIVGRVRLCLDFSATLHLLHLVLSTLHTHHVPSSMFWWVLNIVSCAIMTIAGEWLCMRWDLEPILLGGARSDPIDGSEPGEGDGGEGEQRGGKGRDKRKKSGV